MTQNQVEKTKAIKTEKIVLQLLPQQQEPKIEEINYETSAQIYSQNPEIQSPQVIIQDNLLYLGYLKLFFLIGKDKKLALN